MPEVVIGIDAGATTTRCLAATAEGVVLGRGVAGGASIRSSQGRPREPFAVAMQQALAGVSVADVRGGVFGVAGAGAAGAQRVEAEAVAAWTQVGLAGTPKVVTDLEVAYSAGTASPAGLLLLSGTGAAAVAFADRRIVRRCDGYGWVLGDEGSAVWLGLAGVRSALHAYDGRGRATRLVTDIARHLDVDPDADLPQVLIARVHGDVPAWLGTLAPLVTAAAADADPVAARIVTQAADRLVAGVHAVRREEDQIVFAGSLLCAEGPLRDAVLAKLPDLAVHEAGPGAVGAIVLALAGLFDGQVSEQLHATVLDGARSATATSAQAATSQ